MSGVSSSTRRWVVAMTVLAVPVAMLFELGIARWMLPPQVNELVALFGGSLTTFAWTLLAFTVLTSIVGILVQPMIARRLMRVDGSQARRQADAELGAFILAASLVQLPAIAAGLMHMLGATIAPALLSGGLATAVVILQALRIKRNE